MLVFSLKEKGILKDVFFGILEFQVEIEEIMGSKGVKVKVFNKGDLVNVIFSFFYSSNMVLELKKILFQWGISWVEFFNFINQGVVVVDYGKVIQQIFYFRLVFLVFENIFREGEYFRVVFKNMGEFFFRGFVSVI